MRLLLVRHAPTSETGRVLTGRLPGVDLSPSGREAAVAMVPRVLPRPPAEVYTSPVARCRQTAAIIADHHRLRPRVLRSLAEVDYGRWSGRSLASLRRLRAWQSLMSSPSRFRFPDGETLAEAQARAVAAVEELAGRHRGDVVVAVTHADVIRVVVAHYLGMPLDFVHRIEAAPLSVSLIVLPPSSGMPSVPVINAGSLPWAGR